MKKILLAFLGLAGMAGSALALDLTPLQIGIWGPTVQLFPEQTRVMGLRLNLAMADNREVVGFDLGVASQAKEMKAIQVNLVNVVKEDFAGVGVGLFNQAGSVAGLQAGLFNNVAHDVSGFQLGLFNLADSVEGIQVGLLNRTTSMRGLQIGLVNLIEEGPVTFFPVLNAAF